MSWKSSVEGSTPIVSYRDALFANKKVKTIGYAPSWERLAPNLSIPEGHTGILTGLIHLVTFAHELPSDTNKAIPCTLLVEVHWDDLPYWHYNFCQHGKKTYRDPCLIDIFMSTYKMTPNFLFLINDQGKEVSCLEPKLCNVVDINLSQHACSDPVVSLYKHHVDH